MLFQGVHQKQILVNWRGAFQAAWIKFPGAAEFMSWTSISLLQEAFMDKNEVAHSCQFYHFSQNPKIDTIKLFQRWVCTLLFFLKLYANNAHMSFLKMPASWSILLHCYFTGFGYAVNRSAHDIPCFTT